MILFNRKKKRKKIADCPVCGTSWQGQSFLFLYSEWAKQNKLDVSQRDIQAYVRRKYTLCNQSRLIEDTTSGEYICPDCHTRFNFQNNEKTK